jgi:hypothetical protein
MMFDLYEVVIIFILIVIVIITILTAVYIYKNWDKEK